MICSPSAIVDVDIRRKSRARYGLIYGEEEGLTFKDLLRKYLVVDK